MPVATKRVDSHMKLKGFDVIRFYGPDYQAYLPGVSAQSVASDAYDTRVILSSLQLRPGMRVASIVCMVQVVYIGVSWH